MISVITPSYQSAPWLPLCIASVADQQGVQWEHIIQDSCSTDGTSEILSRHPHVLSYTEKDGGMYDAINRGFDRSSGEVLSYLNCDEQYLPGTLRAVAQFFEAHPETDVLFSGFIVTDANGTYICSRKVLPPLKAHTRVCHLSPFTCGMFFRKRVFAEHGLRFNVAFRDLGDAEWVLRVLDRGLTISILPGMSAVFTDTGDNMNLKPNAQEERKTLFEAAPAWEQHCAALIALHHRIRRLARGVYWQKPFEYKIYTRSAPGRRTAFQVNQPTTIWRDRLTILR